MIGRVSLPEHEGDLNDVPDDDLPAKTAKDAKDAKGGTVGNRAKDANAASPGDVGSVGTVPGPWPEGSLGEAAQ